MATKSGTRKNNQRRPNASDRFIAVRVHRTCWDRVQNATHALKERANDGLRVPVARVAYANVLDAMVDHAIKEWELNV